MDSNNVKNIMVVAANGLGRSGVPNVIFQLTSCLSKHINVDIVVFNNDDYYYDKIRMTGANIIKIDLKEPVHKFKRMIWRFLREKHNTISLFSKLFMNKEYSVIHSFREIDSAYIFVAAKKCGVENRIIHCNNEIKQTRNLISKYFYLKKFKIIRTLTTKLIGVSSTCCSVSYPNMPFDILFNSYDEEKYKKVIPCSLLDNELVLTHIGTFSERKNQLFSIELIYEIRKRVPSAKLNLVGTEVEQGYLTKIKKRINELKLDDFVDLYDGSKDFYNVLSNTSYVILPSIREAAPIVLVEMQASGIMCFSSNTVTRDMECGGVKYIDIVNINKWVDEICSYFITNKNNRCTYDVGIFSTDHFCKNLLNIYSKIGKV